MPRYFFDVNRDGSENRDDDGRKLAGSKEARTHAAHVATDLVSKPDQLAEGGDTVAVDARDDAGNHVCTARLELNDRTD